MKNKKLDAGDVIVTIAVLLAMSCIMMYVIVFIYKAFA